MKSHLQILTIFLFLFCCNLACAETYQPIHDGATIPCADGHPMTLINNKDSHPGTYNEVMTFVQKDKTNEIPYDTRTFICVDSAETLHNNAEAAGLDCGVVLLTFGTKNNNEAKSYYGHAINEFKLKDGSRLYVDPTNDYVANVHGGDNFFEWKPNGNLITYNDQIIKEIWTTW